MKIVSLDWNLFLLKNKVLLLSQVYILTFPYIKQIKV
jgi:hypothetical protein